MRRDRAERPKLTLVALALAVGLTPPTLHAREAGDRPALDNWSDLRSALERCWQVPPDTKGSLIAFRFGLDKSGALRSKPLISARRLQGDADTRRRYEDAALQALDRCFPAPVTPSFGAVLGESPIVLRFANTPPTAAYQMNSNMTIFAPP